MLHQKHNKHVIPFLGTMSRKSLESSSSNDEGTSVNGVNNKHEYTSKNEEPSSSSDVIHRSKPSNKVSNGRSFRDVILNSMESEREKDEASIKQADDSSDAGKENVFSPSPTPSSLSSCSSLNSSPLLSSSGNNLMKGNTGREYNRRSRKTKNKTHQSLTNNIRKKSNENLTSNDTLTGRHEKIDNVPIGMIQESGISNNTIVVDTAGFESVTSKNNKPNGKANIRDNLSSPTNCSCSNIINNNNRRFSNKLGHKKSKR